MKIGIDCRKFYDSQQNAGAGIERYTYHLVRSLLHQDTVNRYTLFFYSVTGFILDPASECGVTMQAGQGGIHYPAVILDLIQDDSWSLGRAKTSPCNSWVEFVT